MQLTCQPIGENPSGLVQPRIKNKDNMLKVYRD